MTVPKTPRLTQIMLLLLVCAATATNNLASTVAITQLQLIKPSDEKVIDWRSYPGQPVEVDDLAVKNVRLAFHQPFSAKALAERSVGEAADWIENLEFTIRNNADKHITYMHVSFGFAVWDVDGPSNSMYHHFVFGVDLRATGLAASYAKPLALDPGETFRFTLPATDLQQIKKNLVMINKTTLANVNRVIVYIPTVGFADGVLWKMGDYSVPKKLLPVDKKSIERTTYKGEPISIRNARVKNIALEMSKKSVPNGFNEELRDVFEFSATAVTAKGGGVAEDWLENFEFTVTNEYRKQITYLCFQLEFPEMEINGLPIGYQMMVGYPREVAPNELQHYKPLALDPGEEVSMTLFAARLESMKQSLMQRKFRLEDLNRVVIRTIQLVFKDGTSWSNGNYFRPKPSAPGGFERIKFW